MIHVASVLTILQTAEMYTLCQLTTNLLIPWIPEIKLARYGNGRGMEMGGGKVYSCMHNVIVMFVRYSTRQLPCDLHRLSHSFAVNCYLAYWKRGARS